MTTAITALARLIGLSLLGQWMDRWPPLVAALLRIAVVTILHSLPIIAIINAQMSYQDLWWWLWLDAIVVGIWIIVITAAQGDNPIFLILHYLLFFTMGASLVMYLGVGPSLEPVQNPGLLTGLGIASFVIQGWGTRRWWWRSARHQLTASQRSGMVFETLFFPYARLMLVWTAALIPLTLEGITSRAATADELHRLANLGAWVAIAKLLLEVVIALINVARAYRLTTSTSPG